MDRDAIHQIDQYFKSLRRYLIYNWVLYGLTLMLCLILLRYEWKHTERYVYYRQQYEGQKVWNSETNYRLNQLEAQILAIKMARGEHQ